MKFADRSQQVLINSIDMINVILDPITHRREFRDECLQKGCFQHGLKDMERVLRVQQDIEELIYCLGISPFALSKPTQIFPDYFSRIVVKMSFGTRRLPEESHEQKRIFPHPFRFHKVKVLTFQQKWTRQDSPAQMKAAKPPLGLFESFQKKGGGSAHARSAAVIQAHETLNGRTFRTCHAAHSPRNLFLLRKKQPVLPSSTRLVQLKPYPPQEIV